MPIDLERLARSTADALPPLTGAQRPVARAVYRLMATGRPATAPAVAGAAGLDPGEVARLLARLPTASLDAGRVTAFLGLQLGPGRHRLRFGEVELATWCAWDTLFIPALVGLAARVESPCVVTGQPVVLRVDPDAGVTQASPAGAALAFLREPRPFAGDVVAGFCRWVNFVVDAAVAESPPATPDARSSGTGLVVLSLEEGVELGRRTNRLVFGHPD